VHSHHVVNWYTIRKVPWLPQYVTINHGIQAHSCNKHTWNTDNWFMNQSKAVSCQQPITIITMWAIQISIWSVFSIPIYYLLKGSKWIPWEHSHIKQWLCLHDNFTFHSKRLSITYISYHFPFTLWHICHNILQWQTPNHSKEVWRRMFGSLWSLRTGKHPYIVSDQHDTRFTAALSSIENY